VVFDTGGISIKPAGGMEDMTMDMGGAADRGRVMRTLALRRRAPTSWASSASWRTCLGHRHRPATWCAP
jgi:hypothetical protein